MSRVILRLLDLRVAARAEGPFFNDDIDDEVPPCLALTYTLWSFHCLLLMSWIILSLPSHADDVLKDDSQEPSLTERLISSFGEGKETTDLV